MSLKSLMQNTLNSANQAQAKVVELKEENIELKLALAESEEARLTAELEMKLALAELAEGGV